MQRLLAALALGALLLASPAAAYDLLTNGSFETASLTGWLTFNQGASGGTGSWYAHTSGNGTYSGLPTSSPPVGAWQAVADNSGRAAAILYRDVTIPATTRATLSFRLWLGNASPGGYVNGSSLNPSSTNQRVRIDVIDPATGLLVTSSGVLRVVYATTAATPAVVNPTTITDDLTSLSGQTVRLRFALVGTAGGIIAGIDDVKLDVSPFAQAADLPGLDTAPARWGDFDGDGRMEIAQAGSDGANRHCLIWKWSPLFGGTWDYYAILSGLDHGCIAAGDVDNDGDLDLGGAGSTPLSVHDLVTHVNVAGGYFGTINHSGTGITEPGTRDGSFEWGDYTLDGHLDAIVSGIATGGGGEYPTTFVGLGWGSGYLTYLGAALPGLGDGQAAWADVLGDGVLDVAQSGGGFSAYQFGALGAGFTSQSAGLPALTSSAVASGDLDNDGRDELVLCGLEGATPVTRVYSIDSYSLAWSAWAAALPGVSEPWVSLGDVDHDGWLDIALCGNTGASRISRIYHNNGNGTFTDLNAALTGVSDGSIELGDFEGDGDLDVLLQGTTGATRVTRIYLNASPGTNAAPWPQVGTLYWMYDETHVAISASSSGYDDHTATHLLSRNFRAGTSPGALDVIAPMSRLTDGRRLLPRPGETRGADHRIVSLTGFGHGSLYWNVQNVDQAFSGSAWSDENTFTPGPWIWEARDIPADQGGKVRLSMYASMLDNAYRANYPATGYNVWRLVPPGAQAEAIAHEGVALSPEAATTRLLGNPARRAGDARVAPRNGDAAGGTTDLPLVTWQGRVFARPTGAALASAFPAGTWEVVDSWFAVQQPTYVVATTTLADSGATGTHDDTFLVTVHTTTPNIWFASLPVSGHSVDNLAPSAPLGLTAAHHTGSGNQLAWQPAPEPDFDGFRVYRGTMPDFVAGPATLVATVTDPAWTDPTYDAPTVYYRVSTLDHAGNESPAVAPGQVTGAPVSAAPLEFALRGASPNPFGAVARIGFALPRDSRVRLDVHDTAGRLVRTVEDGTFAAGEHAAEWAGDDRSGRRVDAGVYFVRLQAGSFVATRRMTYLP